MPDGSFHHSPQTIEVLRLQLELAQCRAERDEALAQQAATAELLQVINRSRGDLVPVFGAMVEKALRLSEAAFGGLLRFDGECFHRAAVRNLPPRLADRDVPLRPVPGMALHRIVNGATLVHIADITDDLAYRAGSPSRVAMVQLGGARSAIWLALRQDDRLLGALVAYRQHVHPFSDRQITLLQNFAAEAVVAIENARLLTQLRARTEEIAEWNRKLEERVAVQLREIEHIGRLKRFLAPQLAELILAGGDSDDILKPHRRNIVVVFADLRGFTAFAEAVEPEEVHALLRDYHAHVGPVVTAFEGTLSHFSGDGVMVFFNDPLPCADPAERAVHMAIAMREAVARQQVEWRQRGREIGFGIGIAEGVATLGEIGFGDRIDYSANGAVCNVAARLCAEAEDGQILISRRFATLVEETVTFEEIGNRRLKGIGQPISVHNIVGLTAPAEPRWGGERTELDDQYPVDICGISSVCKRDGLRP